MSTADQIDDIKIGALRTAYEATQERIDDHITALDRAIRNRDDYARNVETLQREIANDQALLAAIEEEIGE